MSRDSAGPAASSWMVAVCLAPGALLAVAFALAGIGSLGWSTSPVLAPPNRSLAEAAGNHDAADAVARVSAGESLVQPAMVRMPLKLQGESVLTPLEAAVLSEWTPMLRLLVDAGALRDPSDLSRLRCLAQRERDRNTIAFLASLDDGHPLHCDGVALPSYQRRPVP